MLEELKEKVLRANLQLVEHGLVLFTWGNVSERDEKTNLVVIKPSGVSYDVMKACDMVVVDLNGNVIEGKLNPSSDTPTHIEIYKKYPQIKGVVHTHSLNATSFAQAGRSIKAYGTTHADYFYGDIPCTRALNNDEIEIDYEKNTGLVIIENFEKSNINPMEIPSILVKNHAPFSFGKDSFDAVHNAVVLENVAKMAMNSELLNGKIERVDQYLLDKHYKRKHGKNAYYGQKESK